MVTINPHSYSKIIAYPFEKSGTRVIKVYDLSGQLASKFLFRGEKVKHKDDMICIATKYINGKFHRIIRNIKEVKLG